MTELALVPPGADEQLDGRDHIAGQQTPTPLTAEALQQPAGRTEHGSVMVERLRRRVSAPGEMNTRQPGKQQQQERRNMLGGF